ncbi:MAG: SAM-dependent methyltransferase, partial [Candidatus Dormibacteraeota bacterium]|nr:SAM-dependent methyltransferase [Candidatus Dormibacteraeota bacterium]
MNLVGIGPGNPGLLTLRAAEAIRAADVIRHPPGVDAAVLGLARPGALIGVLAELEEVLHLARHDHRVTVLYFGDPFTFGDAAGLAERLHQEQIEFEVVPGVLVEAAGPTISGISSTVLGRAPAKGETAAFRVVAGHMRERVAELLEAGHAPGAAAVVIFNPGGPGQRKVMSPLRHLGGAAAHGVEHEVVLVVGPGVEATARLDSLMGRPLHGRRVLVTRARHQAEEFHRHLADLGAWVVDIPTIEVRPLRVDAKTRDAVARLAETQLVVFASANAVEIFFDMLFELRRDARALSGSS